MTVYKLKVIRKPLPANTLQDIRPKFPPLPNLYLDLLENKNRQPINR